MRNCFKWTENIPNSKNDKFVLTSKIGNEEKFFIKSDKSNPKIAEKIGYKYYFFSFVRLFMKEQLKFIKNCRIRSKFN